MKVVFIHDEIEDNQLMLCCCDIDKKCKLIYKKFKYTNCTIDSFTSLLKFIVLADKVEDKVEFKFKDMIIFTCRVDEFKEKITKFKASQKQKLYWLLDDRRM